MRSTHDIHLGKNTRITLPNQQRLLKHIVLTRACIRHFISKISKFVPRKFYTNTTGIIRTPLLSNAVSPTFVRKAGKSNEPAIPPNNKASWRYNKRRSHRNSNHIPLLSIERTFPWTTASFIVLK